MPEIDPQSSSRETPAAPVDSIATPTSPTACDPQRVQVMCPAEIAADAMKGRKPLVAVISYSKP